MTSSIVDICNMALLNVTRTTITSIDANQVEAIWCKTYFTHIRDALLRSHFWNFAKKRQTLQKLTDIPPFEFSNTFDLPADYIRSVKLHDTSAVFKVEGKTLLTDDNTVNLIYIARVTDTTQFDDLFIATFVALLAAALAKPVTGSEDLKPALLREAKEKLNEAKRRDGQEDTPDNLETNTLTDSRRNSAFTATWDLG